MDLQCITPPDDAEVLNILSVAEFKREMRIAYVKEDAVAEDCIREAYGHFDGEDGWLRRALLTQTWELTLPGWVKQKFNRDRDGDPVMEWVPTNEIILPLPPLQSVTSVKYYASGVLTTFDAASYTVTKTGLFGRIRLAHNVTWPTGLDTRPDSVTIRFVAGYGAGADVKKLKPLRKAIKLLAGDGFRNREDTYAEPRLVAVDRKIKNGVQFYAGRYQVPRQYA